MNYAKTSVSCLLLSNQHPIARELSRSPFPITAVSSSPTRHDACDRLAAPPRLHATPLPSGSNRVGLLRRPLPTPAPDLVRVAACGFDGCGGSRPVREGGSRGVGVPGHSFQDAAEVLHDRGSFTPSNTCAFEIFFVHHHHDWMKQLQFQRLSNFTKHKSTACLVALCLTLPPTVMTISLCIQSHTLWLLSLPDFLDVSIGKILKLRSKIASATSAIKSVFGQEVQQQDAANKLEQLREGIVKVRELFRDTESTEFIIMTIPTVTIVCLTLQLPARPTVQTCKRASTRRSPMTGDVHSYHRPPTKNDLIGCATRDPKAHPTALGKIQMLLV
ncbi:uncharacterized protein LOC133914855 [Phragmites australis]|uniref:uncharacterized protein LOC133914855 n=1 Tax=Phragmites australis TaxID=29695 RepID=UPI002D7795C0|nr:uncharacterized protein LOC133914855 [Phragmites australis]